MPVNFCVLANLPESAAIATIAATWAALDPNARAVLISTDQGYPSAENITAWTGTTQNAGAVVLKKDGTLFKVLTITQAQNGGIIDLTFSEAWLA